MTHQISLRHRAIGALDRVPVPQGPPTNERTPMAPLENGFRAIDATIHDLDERSHRVVIDIPHDTVDSYDTCFAPSCFRSSFERRLPVMLREHDPRDRVGQATSAEVLSHANRIVGQFEPFESNDCARRTFEDIRLGKLRGYSFFFRNAIAAETDKRSARGRRVKRYVRAEMPEFSAVAHPSIPGTRTVELRSIELEAFFDAEAQLRSDVAGQDLAIAERRLLGLIGDRRLPQRERLAAAAALRGNHHDKPAVQRSHRIAQEIHQLAARRGIRTGGMRR